MADHVRGKRSPVTCHFKCGNACLGPECNTSSNPAFREIASAALSRRALLGLGAAGAVGIALAPRRRPVRPLAAPGGGASAPSAACRSTRSRRCRSSSTTSTCPRATHWAPIIRWGDPLFSGVPALDFDNQTPEAQAGQFGYNCDYLDIIADRERPHGHAREQPRVRQPGHHVPADERPRRTRPTRAAIFKAAHGFSVVELRRSKLGQPWRYLVDGRRNRRITADTVFELTGPAAGTDS